MTKAQFIALIDQVEAAHAKAGGGHWPIQRRAYDEIEAAQWQLLAGRDIVLQRPSLSERLTPGTMASNPVFPASELAKYRANAAVL